MTWGQGMSHSQEDRADNVIRTAYWHLDDDGLVVCDLCPRNCHLREGKKGACFVREARNGEIVFTSYGLSSGFCVDPIEKKPLNHYFPGSAVLSFGTAGCNLACKFCQNWQISKSRQMNTLAQHVSPQQIAEMAQRYGCQSVAYTYNDPVIFIEYAVDTAQACLEQGIESVAVTAGYINSQPRREFFRHMQAANVDLKAFTERFYRKLCAGHLAPVLDTLLYLKHETSVWLEITTLLIPGENDSDHELHQLATWIYDNLGPDVPLHFSAFHPDFKLTDKPFTPPATLLNARQIALQHGLHYVYIGNMHDVQADSTYCPSCKECVIERDWYQLGKMNITEQGRCGYCGAQIAGRFAASGTPFGRRRIPVSF